MRLRRQRGSKANQLPLIRDQRRSVRKERESPRYRRRRGRR